MTAKILKKTAISKLCHIAAERAAGTMTTIKSIMSGCSIRPWNGGEEISDVALAGTLWLLGGCCRIPATQSSSLSRDRSTVGNCSGDLPVRVPPGKSGAFCASVRAAFCGYITAIFWKRRAKVLKPPSGKITRCAPGRSPGSRSNR